MDYVTEQLARYSLSMVPPEEDGDGRGSRRTTGYSSKAARPSYVSNEKVKLSIVDKSAFAKVARYMNTYRLESRRPFNVESVQRVLQEVLTRDLAEVHYEPTNITRLGVNITGEIRTRVKQLNFDRYKIVCVVQIVEKHQQSILSTAKFLWDADRDRYASFSLNNAHIAAMACVFGIYFE